MNWGDLRTEIRVEIEDMGTTPKYPNALLYTFLRDALADYSQYLPLTKDNVELTADTGNAMKFALPADFVREISVRCPETRYLEPQRGRLGTRVVRSTGKPLFYRVDGTTWLFLDVDPGANAVVLEYYARHPLPADEDDDAFELTVPDNDMELLKLYVEAKINTKIRNAQARLDRFKLGSSDRTDNPLTYEVIDFFANYREKLQARIPNLPVMLYRPRRYK